MRNVRKNAALKSAAFLRLFAMHYAFGSAVVPGCAQK